MALQTVHLRINDAATGTPTPCRLRISDTSGCEFAPFGRSNQFPIGRGEDVGGKLRVGRESWLTIDGTCEMALPPGGLRIQARKGPEYAVLDERVVLTAGKMALRFELKRQFNHRDDGWLAVDMRSHFAPPHAALLDARADDLDVVNLVAEPVHYLGRDGNSYLMVPNLEAYSGQGPALSFEQTRVDVNTHNRHPVLGSFALLNTHRVVFPLTFGGADATDDWSLGDWAQQGHRKGGLVVWTAPFSKPAPHGAEALALAILGEVDAIELSDATWESALRGWYQLLNCGCVRPIVGASGRESNAGSLTPLRTLVKPVEGSWVAGVKAGNTVVTNGPLLDLRMAGNRAIAKVVGNSAGARLDIIANGANIATTQDDVIEVDGPTDAWVAARWLAPGGGFAHTSALVNGTVPRNSKSTEILAARLAIGLEWVESIGRFEQPKSKEHLLETLAAAHNRLTADI